MMTNYRLEPAFRLRWHADVDIIIHVREGFVFDKDSLTRGDVAKGAVTRARIKRRQSRIESLIYIVVVGGRQRSFN
jgi:hypothetical protein